MDNKTAIIRELDDISPSLLPEVLDFIQFIKHKHQLDEPKTVPTLAKKNTLVSKKSASDNKIIIYTDGACTGNPGKGGYGAVIIEGEDRRELSAGYKLTTNNRMEMMGAIAALKSLEPKSRVTLHSDSKYIVDAINKGWAKKWQAKGWMRNAKERAKNPDLWQEILDLGQQHDIDFVWVKGHAGIPENERCDRLAVAAAHQRNLLIDKGYEDY